MGSEPATNSPIVVALDNLSEAEVDRLTPMVAADGWGVKINDAAHAPWIRGVLDRHRPRLFVDSKLHDIPNTVANTVARICDSYAPSLLTIHASGGAAMIEAALTAAEKAGTVTTILCVTALTSLDAAATEAVYGADPATVVDRLASVAQSAGATAIVCSPHEVAAMSARGLRCLVPGIRPVWFTAEQPGAADDQRRTATPADALAAGATWLVIGRPIVRAADPAEALRKTNAEIGRGA